MSFFWLETWNSMLVDLRLLIEILKEMFDSTLEKHLNF